MGKNPEAMNDALIIGESGAILAVMIIKLIVEPLLVFAGARAFELMNLSACHRSRHAIGNVAAAVGAAMELGGARLSTDYCHVRYKPNATADVPALQCDSALLGTGVDRPKQPFYF
jgi:hypothetical protein